MSERSEDRELTALETQLRELRPQSDALDRAVLMYRAGRASVRSWVWPAATLFSSVGALVLGIAMWLRPAPPIVYVAFPSVRNDSLAAAPPSPSFADGPERGAWSRYVHLQEQVLLHGLDGLPSPPSGADEPPPDAEALLNSL
jgi:hypothetical protein